jgi:DNA polymerase-3 subunit gamma/tau
VDDTRELLDNVQYAPSRGRFKVYLIDEVHMLSKNAFNALLKTLEEPPPHVKFLLATTDPQKIPVTVLSRCLQFNLKRLPVSLIEGRLTHILVAENIPFETAAVPLLAHAADGSLRDALSLLDQAIAFGGGEVKTADVRTMLGSIEKTHIRALLEAVIGGSGARILAAVAQLDELAPDYQMALDDLAAVLQRIALAQAVPQAAAEFDEAEVIKALAERMDPGEVQLYYQVALFGKRDLPLAPSPRAGFEMTLLRMLAFRPLEAQPREASPASDNTTPVPSTSPQSAARPTHPAAAWHEPDWFQLIDQLDMRGAAQQLAANCVYRNREGNQLLLEISPEHKQIATEQLVGRLEEALSKHFGESLRVKIQVSQRVLETPAKIDEKHEVARLEAARAAIDADPNVRALRETFSAQVKTELVKPLD